MPSEKKAAKPAPAKPAASKPAAQPAKAAPVTARKPAKSGQQGKKP